MKEPEIQCCVSVCSRGGAGIRLSAAVALVALGVMLLLGSAPASALLSQGHVFSGTFKGSGGQGFGTPGGVAVNEASGIVFVSDPSDERVELFKAGGGGYEFVGELKVPDAGVIAVDNNPNSEAEPSGGDVYVAGGEERGSGEEGVEERTFLYKFSAPVENASGEIITPGEKIFKKHEYKYKRKVEGLEEELLEEVELERISGLAVDAAGKLWVYWSEAGNIYGFSNEVENRLLPSLIKEAVLELPALSVGCLAEPGFAVGAGDEVFYVAHEREDGLETCPSEEEKSSTTVVSKLAGSEEATKRSLDNQDSTGVALDAASGEVYLDNVDSVAVFGPEGSFVQRFGLEDLKKGGAVAVDSARGIVFVGEPGKVAVFTREAAGAPTVDSVSAENLTPSSERVNAQIDPGGAKTTYRVQYGTVSCIEHESSCTSTPAQEVGDGFGDVAVQATLGGLESNTPYFYRVIANNEHGTAVSSQSTFLTMLPSSEGVLLDNRQWELVSPVERHGATPEPISEEGALIQAAADGNSLAWTASAPFTREAEGNRAPEPVQAISGRGSEEWSSKNITTPRNKGEGVSTGEPAEYRFFSSDLSFAVVQPQFLGSEEPLENPPLAPGAREKDIYQRNDDTGEFEALVTAANDATGEPWAHKLQFQGATADARHVVFKSDVPLVSGAGETGLYEWEADAPLKFLSVLPGSRRKPASEPQLGFKGFDVRGAISQDGSRVFWTNEEEKGPLYMSDTATGETIQINAAQGVREARGEEVEDNLDEVYFQVASDDGSKVFFTDSWPLTSESTLEPSEQQPEPRPADLYEFDVETGKLTDLTVTRNAGEQAEVLGTIPGISEDGSYVYFVANGVLVPGADPGNCSRENVRNEQLERGLEGKCNLYVSGPDLEHPGLRQTRLIARLSEEDSADWSTGAWPGPANLGGLTSRVSGNGRYLAFMSDQKLTGYDNVDANPEAKGPHGKGLALDQEVFLYDASTGRLVCSSCNPQGHAPHGVFDTEDAGEGLFLTVDRPDLWSGRWLAGSIPGWTRYGQTVLADHQSRYLSNDGRLFFNSADALVPQVQARSREENVEGKTLQVGVENVYEYEPQGIGSCQQAGGCVALVSSGESDHESAFLDASENGNDVFFLTAAKLVAQETESGYDIYDARSCGTAETGACLPERKMPPPPCTGEGCRPPVSGQPSFELPPSFVSGPSSPGEHPPGPPKNKKATPKPLTRAQKLAAALKTCHRLKQKKRRVACERKARKAYGAKARPTKATAHRTAATAHRGASSRRRGR